MRAVKAGDSGLRPASCSDVGKTHMEYASRVNPPCAIGLNGLGVSTLHFLHKALG